MPLTNYALDKFVAPGLSSFTSAEIPWISHRPHRWFDNFILNSVLRRAYDEDAQAFVYNLLRRVEAAYQSHAEARALTHRFLGGKESNQTAPSTYINALLHWEVFLSQSWMAFALLIRFAESVAPPENHSNMKMFTKGDGSLHERLNLLYNRSKHSEKAITTGQLPAGGTVAVWLENDGIRSTNASLTWKETGEVLEELAQWAHGLEDRLSVKERLRHEEKEGESAESDTTG